MYKKIFLHDDFEFFKNICEEICEAAKNRSS